MSKNVERAKRHMALAFEKLNRIPVSGANVDYMAYARQELRTAYELLDKKKPQLESKDDTEVQDNE